MKVRISTVIFLFALLPLLVVSALGTEDQIPSHPRDLSFSPLQYDPPNPREYRQVLNNGVVAYMVEDHELPLVNISFVIRAGDYLEPQGKTGLAGMVGSVLRSGGTQKRSADEFDEEADFLAAGISSSLGGWSGGASVNALSKDLDLALELFFEMLRTPGFQQDRIDLAKSQILQAMERRNDRTTSIEGREWERLMRGESHFTTVPSTKASIEGISREDLLEYHRKYYHPGNFLIAASGDFNIAELKAKLESYLADWPTGEIAPSVPGSSHIPEPGVYLVDKSDVNQGRVSLGHLSIELGDPDEYALDLMNEVLGGSGFTSRVLRRIRSDEGLAYSAGTSLSTGVHYPGVFRGFFQSKSATCAEAAQIILEEIDRIRTEKVSEEELQTVKTNVIETFPRLFSTASAVAGTFASAELIGRDLDYYAGYRDRIQAVTVDDVLRVAQEHLHPEKLVLLAVGNAQDMLAGNPDKPEYSFQKLAGEKGIRTIPLPDPMTMVYPENR